MDYTVKIEGFLLGKWKSVGDTVQLTEKQARTFVREGRIAPKGQKSRKSAPKADEKAEAKS